jgi:hypothetical protein
MTALNGDESIYFTQGIISTVYHRTKLRLGSCLLIWNLCFSPGIIHYHSSVNRVTALWNHLPLWVLRVYFPASLLQINCSTRGKGRMEALKLADIYRNTRWKTYRFIILKINITDFLEKIIFSFLPVHVC